MDGTLSPVRYAALDGKGWRRGPAVITKNGRLKADTMILGGVEVYAPRGRFQIRKYDDNRPAYIDLGNDPTDALSRFRAEEAKRELRLAAARAGIALTPEAEDRKSLKKFAVDFIAMHRDLPHRSDDSVGVYAHATLSLACATRYFEIEPANKWLERPEFHCGCALELSPDLPEAHVAKAFLLWSPSRNFQHLDAIGELRKAIALQKNLPHAYNRLGTILAHIGLLDRAREMYERGRPFQPKNAVNHSIVQVYIWNRELDAAVEEIRAWRAESPGNKYAIYFAPQPAMMIGDWKEARALLDEAIRLFPEEPLIVSLLGVYWALMGNAEKSLECVARACGTARSFGHAYHTYYQTACIFALLGRRDVALEWLERSVNCGFACWPFFLKDNCLQNLRSLPEFETLVGSLQAKYPDHLGLL